MVADGMSFHHLLFIIFICLMWGFTFVAGKAGVVEFPPIFFTGLRYLLLSLCLCFLLRWQKGCMGIIAIISLTMGGVHFALFYMGLALSSTVSSVAILAQMGVPFATIFSALYLKEKVGWRRWSAISLSFLGTMIIGLSFAAFENILAFTFVLLAAFLGGIGTVLMKKLPHVGVFQLQAWIATLSFPVLFVSSLLLENQQLQAIETASLTAWGGVAYTALGSSLVGHAGMFYLLKRYDVSTVVPITLLAPVFGVIFGVAIWGDELTLRFIIGSLITITGVMIISLRKKELVTTNA